MIRRRDFLRAAALPALARCPPAAAAASPRQRRAILLMLVGGPSHLDTWDMKPDAPAEIRGPFRPIRTSVPGIRISEIFPRMARLAHHYALIRSVHHDAAPIHDTGHQLMQTGRLSGYGPEHPHIGCVVSRLTGARSVLLPYPIGSTGGNLPHGQSAGYLGEEHDLALLGPEEAGVAREPARLREKYGRNLFGESCLAARRLVESGAGVVTVNMFDTVFDRVTWDIHGFAPFSTLASYRDTVGPMFDMAYSALIEDLASRGLLEETLVVAMGEFGRTPRINAAGGRDHWPHCWTIVMAGGGVKGGQVIGASDATGAEPGDRPVTPAEVAATIYYSLGVPLDAAPRDAEGRRTPVVDTGVKPVAELFA